MYHNFDLSCEERYANVCTLAVIQPDTVGYCLVASTLINVIDISRCENEILKLFRCGH